MRKRFLLILYVILTPIFLSGLAQAACVSDVNFTKDGKAFANITGAGVGKLSIKNGEEPFTFIANVDDLKMVSFLNKGAEATLEIKDTKKINIMDKAGDKFEVKFIRNDECKWKKPEKADSFKFKVLSEGIMNSIEASADKIEALSCEKNKN
ncbi:hypothetical protein LCGC14_2005770, partial [marine sediment metagenome]